LIAILNLFYVGTLQVLFLTAVHELRDQVPIWAFRVFVKDATIRIRRMQILTFKIRPMRMRIVAFIM